MAVDITPSALLEFAKTIKGNAGSTGNARVATVTRIDKDGVAYVALPGGVDETPLATSGALLGVGDTVYVTMSGGKLRAVNNYTEPSIGANVVRRVTSSIEQAVRNAKKTADEAEAVAVAVNQHFWDDDNGAHVTDVTQDEWKKAVDDNFSDLSDSKQYNNLLMNSLGILLRSALNNLVSITRSAIAFYDGLGNNAANIVAQFGSNGAQIGKISAAHSIIDADGQRFYGSDGSTELANIGYGEGAAQSGTAVAPYYTFGVRANNSVIGNYSMAEGRTTTASGFNSHAEGTTTNATAGSSHAEGVGTTASGMQSHAEGGYTESSGVDSHAEGQYTVASGFASHAEGSGLSSYKIIASGDGAHAEGKASNNYSITADGIGSHAEGYAQHGDIVATGSGAHAEGVSSIADGYATHAQNLGTVAASPHQTALGKYNVADNLSTYALIIGNGTADDARSNAFAVDWDGGITTAKPLFKSVSATSAAQTINAGAGVNFTITVNVPNGYTLFAVAGQTSNHNLAGTIGSARVTGANTVSTSLTNRTTSTNWTDATVTVDTLCVLSTVV